MTATMFSLERYTLQELTAMRAMCDDAIDTVREAGGLPEPRMVALLAAYDERIAALAGDPRPAHDEQVTVGRQAGSATSNQYGTFAVHAATEKQVRFLQRLIDEKDAGSVKLPSTLEGISKKAATALIDQLIDRPAKPSTHKAPPAEWRRPSDKQFNFIRKLLSEKDLDGVVFNPPEDPTAEICGFQNWQGHVATLNSKTATAAIDFLVSLPRKQQTQTAQVDFTPGAYRVGEKIVRVYLGQQSGKMLAAELVDVTAEDRDDAWRYLGLATRFVSETDHRLTIEEAEALAASGATHSWCCVCGRRLDDPNSVNRGIGPVCRAKQGGI